MIVQKFDYDDPYKILAHHIVGFYRPPEVIKILTENGYILNVIQKEVRGLDLGGPFIDCTIEDIYAQKKRVEYMEKLDELAKYYFSILDKNRLKKEIRAILEEMGVTV